MNKYKLQNSRGAPDSFRAPRFNGGEGTLKASKRSFQRYINASNPFRDSERLAVGERRKGGTPSRVPPSEQQQGIAIILSVFVLSAILSIAMGISTLLLREVQFAKTAGFSVPAFFAADTGVEKILMLRDSPQAFSECISAASPCTLQNGANFWIAVRAFGEGGCTAPTFCIESTGEFRGTRRAIEVNY